MCSADLGSVITAGGGFSGFSPQPSYQAAAVQAYFATAEGDPQSAPLNTPPGEAITDIQQGFNPGNRGYPDVAMAGDRFLVVIGGNAFVLSGTSASAPGKSFVKANVRF